MLLRFFAKLLLFLSPILLLLGVVEHRLGSAHSGYRTKRAYLEQGIGRYEVIVVGSSHPYYAVKADMLGAPAYNASYVAQDVYYDSRILLKYLPRAERLRLVVLTASYFTFQTRLEDYSEGWRASHYRRFWDIPRANRGFKIEDHSLIALYGIPQARAFLLGGFPESSREQIGEDGSKADYLGPGPDVEASGRAAVEAQNAILDPKYVAENVRYFEEMLDALKARGVDVVIITTPAVRGYYENMRPDAYRLMQEKVQYLCQKYGLTYYNYLTDPRFTAEDYSDGNHLNTRGAEKFSRILRDEVVGPRLRPGDAGRR